LIIASVVITIIGAIIDLVFLYDQHVIHSRDDDPYYVLKYNPINWAFATVLILISIILIIFIFLPLDKIIVIPISGFISILNPVWWYLILIYEDGLPCSSLTIFLFISLLLIVYFAHIKIKSN